MIGKFLLKKYKAWKDRPCDCDTCTGKGITSRSAEHQYIYTAHSRMWAKGGKVHVKTRYVRRR